MTCLMQTSSAEIGTDFTLNANFDLIGYGCLECCAKEESEAVSRLQA